MNEAKISGTGATEPKEKQSIGEDANENGQWKYIKHGQLSVLKPSLIANIDLFNPKTLYFCNA